METDACVLCLVVTCVVVVHAFHQCIRAIIYFHGVPQ